MRRTHRIVGALWILSLALTYAVSAAGAELPGPSIPGLSFIALIITGTYLLLRPWVRNDSTVSARWKRLTKWNVTLPVLVRRTHRIFATMCLLFIGIAISLEVVGGTQSSLVILAIVSFLVVLVITGVSMFLSPWVNRFRAR